MRVVVAGGGIAALETLAALHARAGDRVDATLLAPETGFSYRPLSTAVPFTFRGERTRPLVELAEGLGARFVRDALADVDDGRSRILTHDGDFLPYDALLLAVGARVGRNSLPGVIFKRDREGIGAFAQLLVELEGAAVRSVAFVVPKGAAWPVDAYELSLVAALAGRRGGGRAKVFLVTAERRPLETLGEAAGDAIAYELARAGVELLAGAALRESEQPEAESADAFSSVIARLAGRDGRAGGRRATLHVAPGSTLAVDRVVSLPVTRGPATPGIPHDSDGFVEVDEHGRIPGTSRLFAAGDATSLSLKHSTLSASQATAAAEAIAAEAGVDLEPQPAPAVLYGILALPPHFPGTEGSPWLDSGEPVSHCLWWPPGHVCGRHLAPYLAARDHAVHPGLLWHPHGLSVAATVGTGAVTPATRPSPVADEQALQTDARARQLLAIQRAAREGERFADELERRGLDVERHERDVVSKLEAAGYLRHGADSPRDHPLRRP